MSTKHTVTERATASGRTLEQLVATQTRVQELEAQNKELLELAMHLNTPERRRFLTLETQQMLSAAIARATTVTTKA